MYFMKHFYRKIQTSLINAISLTFSKERKNTLVIIIAFFSLSVCRHKESIIDRHLFMETYKCTEITNLSVLCRQILFMTFILYNFF